MAIPLLPRLLRWLRQVLLLPQPEPLPLPLPPSITAAEAWHTLEQCHWLAELQLLQLAQALERAARQQGGYDADAFDVLIAIADALEEQHGWSVQQTEAWLSRLGAWDELL